MQVSNGSSAEDCSNIPINPTTRVVSPKHKLHPTTDDTDNDDIYLHPYSIDPSLPDLVDHSGHKSADQLTEDFDLKSLSTDWSAQDINALIREKGEWIYELYAVLIHSGGCMYMNLCICMFVYLRIFHG